MGSMWWETLGYLLLVVVGPPVAIVLHRGYARRKTRRARERGEDVRIGVLLRGTQQPYPRKWRQGSVRTGESPLLFRPWYRLGAYVPLAGLTLVRREAGMAGNAPEPQAVFRMRDAEGGVVELATHPEYADVVHDALRGEAAPAVAARRRRPPGPVLFLAALGVVWLAGWAYIATAGEVLTVEVLRNDEGYCDVRWTHGAATHTAEVECDDDEVGDPIRILTMPPPFRSEAADVVYTPWYVGVLATILIGPLVLWPPLHLLNAWRRRRRPAPPPAPAVEAEPEVPRLERHELRHSAIAAHVERRAAAEGWRETRPPRWVHLVSTPERRIVSRALANGGVALFLLGLVVLGNHTSLAARRLDHRDGVAVEAVVDYTSGTWFPFVPDDADVHYVVDGRTVEATVPAGRELDGGEKVTVLYDPSKPSRARLAEHDGTARGLAVVATASAFTGALVVLFAVRAVLALVTLRRYRREEPLTVRYAITRGGADLGLLTFSTDGDPRPDFLVPLANPLPGDVPYTGTAEVRGLADGTRPLVTAGGHELYSHEPAFVIEDTEALRAFVNGEFPDEDDE
jgi:hypothetical protein